MSLTNSIASGLEFLFDVKTTLNISSVAFFESQTVHGYDLFATASNMDDVLYLNLFSGNVTLGKPQIHYINMRTFVGKVEIISGVGTSIQHPTNTWSNPNREISSAGKFQIIYTYTALSFM